MVGPKNIIKYPTKEYTAEPSNSFGFDLLFIAYLLKGL